MKKYGKFLVMIGVSTVIMFCMMYFNVYALDHHAVIYVEDV